LRVDGTGGVNDQPYVDWYGYSVTAGENYDLANSPVPPENVPQQTGIVPLGGIPVLDANLPWRAQLYANDQTPLDINLAIINQLTAQGVNPATWNGEGTINALVAQEVSAENTNSAQTVPEKTASGGPKPTSSGIIPTPTQRP